MKNIQRLYLPFVIIPFLSFNVHSQILAVTEYNDTIYVYDNGTWSFEATEQMPEVNELAYLEEVVLLDTIDQKFERNTEVNKQINMPNGQFTIHYKDSDWQRIPPAQLNDEADFAFEAKKNDIWCIVIAEETEIAPDKLYLIAKQTMSENSGGKPEVIKTQFRNVNGINLIRGTLKASFSGIEFIFDTYYYSDSRGSVQFTTWTSANVWKNNEDMITDFLNGFVVNN